LLEEWRPPNEVQYRITDSFAGPYAHLYVHDLDANSQFPLFARVIFYEVPPGSIGISTVVSVSTTLALGVIASVSNAFVNHSSVDTSIAALILALPATIAFWLQPSPERHELGVAPLSSRLGLIASGGLAYVGALLLIAIGAEAPLSGWVGSIFRAALIIVPALSLWCSIVLVRKWKLALERWRRIQEGRPGANEAREIC